ncbi:MAG: lipoyl synthase [Halobacteria archaeon]
MEGSSTEGNTDTEGKPDWLRREWRPERESFDHIREALRKRDLATVCEEASCPNIDECWSQEGTATFMIMGDSCTRTCGFCNVDTGGGEDLDPLEPAKIAGAVDDIGLDYVVITSVDRDDVPDGGSRHFAKVVKAVKFKSDALVEVLIPDFQGERECLSRIVEEQPTVVAHNLETVERLQTEVRDPRAGYGQSLDVLRNVKEMDDGIFTKSSLMLGLGESEDEVLEAMHDLREAGVDVVTFGQYLQPSDDHLEIQEWVPPDKFDRFEEIADEMGFRFCASGPFVRSSYKAGELFIKNVVEKGGEPSPL